MKLRPPRLDNWVHLDNCERYTGDLPQVILQQHRALTGSECEDIGESQPESDSIPPILNGEADTASEGDIAEERRYPRRKSDLHGTSPTTRTGIGVHIMEQ